MWQQEAGTLSASVVSVFKEEGGAVDLPQMTFFFRWRRSLCVGLE